MPVKKNNYKRQMVHYQSMNNSNRDKKVRDTQTLYIFLKKLLYRDTKQNVKIASDEAGASIRGVLINMIKSAYYSIQVMAIV